VVRFVKRRSRDRYACAGGARILRGRRPGVVALIESESPELVHARVGEAQGRVVCGTSDDECHLAGGPFR